MSSVHRTINIKWFKKFNERLEQYPKQPPHTRAEAIERAKNGEITEIAGEDPENKVYDVLWTDCHPGHASTIDYELFNSYIPSQTKDYLLLKFQPLRSRQLRDTVEDMESVPSSKDTNLSLQNPSSDSLTTPSSSEETNSSDESSTPNTSLKRKTKNRDDSNQTGENVRKSMRIYYITRT